jgi:release factor glutamine methyltransferase
MFPLSSYVRNGTARISFGTHRDHACWDAEALLLHVLDKDKAWLMTHADEELPDEQATRFLALIDRRSTGEPIQYIIGETEFYGLPFRVTPDVLIPRPETEHLVEKALELAAQVRDAGAKAQNGISAFAARLKSCPDTEPPLSSPFKTLRIVDIGTGSGAIAVTLAHKLPQSQVTAIDLSQAALAIARENAKRSDVVIRFLEGDLLAPVAGEQFEIIVSNPPYVPETDRDSLSVEVRDYEPSLALFAGEDGLEVYRRLIPAAFDALVPGGFLLLEIGYGQSPAIAELLTGSGFEQIEFIPDLQGIPRVACASRKA